MTHHRTLAPMMAALTGACAHHAGGSGHEHHGSQPGMHHAFTGAQEWAKRWDDPERDAWQKPELVIDAMGLTATSKVADLGAGTGYFVVRLARAVPNGVVHAVDIEPEMLTYLRERAQREGLGNVQVVAAAPDNPNLTGELDAVLVCNTYHHLDARTAYFQRLRAHLVAGGRLAIVDFNLTAEHGPPREHRLSPDQVVSELSAAGYVLERRDESSLPQQYIVVMRAP